MAYEIKIWGGTIKNIDLVFKFVKEKVPLDILMRSAEDNKPIGINAVDIQNNLGIIRNNGTKLLNKLFKEKKLIKINSRPVTYIPREIIFQLLDGKEVKDTYSIDEIKKILKSSIKCDTQSDPFDILIGKEKSLATQIGQAKAAIMYPPNGLYTLILGESGVGKTTFAYTMYKYARKTKNLSEKEFPFVSFNCSDYFNNPQLLLSQLFGHVKGAFTGADDDKIGIVEKADGGVLFLDEVHRLPSDGQEMLFYLMDKGEYHRLGETGKKRKSNVLIIAATTEKPDGILLHTFLRRFPVIITLPPYREKDISERVEIIGELFLSESKNLNKPISIAPEVIKALALYKFKIGNIGELRSEIKLLCAKSYLEFLKSKEKLRVDFKYLDANIKEYFLMNNNISSSARSYLNVFSNDLVLSPEFCNTYLPERFGKDIYEFIDRKINDLKEKGLTQAQIDKEVNLEIENYFNNVLKTSDLSKLYKIIPKNIVDVSAELISIAEKDLETKLNSRLVIGLAFHLDALLKRLKNNEVNNSTLINKLEIKAKYPDEYKTASKLVSKIKSIFNYEIPESEKIFITILLANNKDTIISTDKVGIIIVCHGKTTATSIAEVSNTLFNTNIVKAIDMPLNNSISETYNRVKLAALSLNRRKGILLFVDMGSLVSLGEKLMSETGIKVKTISNVSTLYVLEATRTILYKNCSLEEIYELITKRYSGVKTNDTIKKKAILTICATGEGTSKMIKDMILKMLPEKYRNEIEVITVNYADCKSNIEKLMDKYVIIAYFGTLNLDIAAPYFPMSKLLSSDFKSEFLNFIDMNVNNKKTQKREGNEYSKARELLEKYVKYINPEMAISSIKQFIDTLNLNFNDKNGDDLINLIVHLGCMLNRCVRGYNVKFDKMEEYKKSNLKQFNILREHIKILEEEYEISINDDEICYILTILNKNNN